MNKLELTQIIEKSLKNLKFAKLSDRLKAEAIVEEIYNNLNSQNSNSNDDAPLTH